MKLKIKYRILKELAPFASIFLITLVCTLLVLTLAAPLFKKAFKSPYWLTALPIKFQPTPPSMVRGQTLPTFYLIGTLPKDFDKKPVLYRLIYRPGPPSHFVHQIEAHFSQPDLQLVFQGPKTPESAPDRKTQRKCLTQDSVLQCLLIRNRILMRYIQESEPISPLSWKMEWFQTEDLLLSEEDQSQGIHLHAVGEKIIQDRFIFIHPTGSHQSIVLTRPKNEFGDRAYQEFLLWIASYRVFTAMSYGQERINRELSEVQLQELKQIRNPQARLKKLIETQALLISKISVDPGSLESYYHLAGTSSLAIQILKRQNTYSYRSVVYGNMKAAVQYAQDIAPKDPRTAQIQALWLELKE